MEINTNSNENMFKSYLKKTYAHVFQVILKKLKKHMQIKFFKIIFILININNYMLILILILKFFKNINFNVGDYNINI